MASPGRVAPEVTSAYARAIGIEVARLSGRRAHLRLPHRGVNANRYGTLHGGAIASLVEAAALAAVGAGTRAPAEATVLDLSVQYVGRAMREAVIAVAEVVRRGRGLTFLTIAVETESGDPVARGVVSCGTGWSGALSAVAGARLPDVPASARPSGSAFGKWLGVRTARLARGVAVAVLPETATADGKCIPAGALAALADGAAGAAAWSAVGFDPHGRAATVALHLSFTGIACVEDAVAHAETAWRAGAICATTVAVTARRSGLPLAIGSVVYRITSPAA
jgi:acyl-CoA thioesterase